MVEKNGGESIVPKRKLIFIVKTKTIKEWKGEILIDGFKI